MTFVLPSWLLLFQGLFSSNRLDARHQLILRLSDTSLYPNYFFSFLSFISYSLLFIINRFLCPANFFISFLTANIDEFCFVESTLPLSGAHTVSNLLYVENICCESVVSFYIGFSFGLPWTRWSSPVFFLIVRGSLRQNVNSEICWGTPPTTTHFLGIPMWIGFSWSKFKVVLLRLRFHALFSTVFKSAFFCTMITHCIQKARVRPFKLAFCAFCAGDCLVHITVSFNIIIR